MSNLGAVWREFFDFLRNPRLPDERIPFGRQAAQQVGVLLLLDWAVVICFVIFALALESGGIELPQEIEEDWTPGEMFLFIVVLAPPLEELIFRVGLSGQRRALTMFVAPWLLVAALIGARFLIGPLDMRTVLVLSVGWLVSTIAVVACHWNDRSLLHGFRRLFPYAFWLTSGLFGLMHIFNYEDPMSLAVLLMVIPQFTGGMMLGYVRVKYGMWSNIAQHVAHNAVFLALYYAWPG